MESNETQHLIDANILIAVFDESDMLHEKALVYMRKRADQSTFYILDHVIQEVLTVFLYAGRGDLAKKCLDLILTDKDLKTVDTSLLHLENALEMAAACNFLPKISFTDWLLISLSKLWNMDLVSFDKQLLNAHKKLT